MNGVPDNMNEWGTVFVSEVRLYVNECGARQHDPIFPLTTRPDLLQCY